MGYSENSKGYRIYVAGQREVEISHDVTFDEDIALSKINNLPIPRKDKEVDTRKQGAKEDETMPDIDEPMDPIDPPPPRRDPHGLGRLSKMPRDILHQGELSMKVRSRTGIKDT